MSDLAPESDRAPPAPHPRATARLIGQDGAVAEVEAALASTRFHHGWLITGPRGVGKATLAWQMARALLRDATGLDRAPDDAIAHRITALSEPRLMLLRRPWDDKTERFKPDIPVDEVRRLKGFFGLSAADGGRRMVIVDAADDLNPSAANALLKVLEEPPRDAVLLLVSHQPSRLLPTIRSRCRELRLGALAPADLRAALEGAGVAPPDGSAALATLSNGSVGDAIRLAEADGPGLYARLVALYAHPLPDRPAMIALADAVSAKGEDRFAIFMTLVELFLSRLARRGVTGPLVQEAAPGEAAVLARLSPDAGRGRAWAQAQATLTPRARQGRALNLDAGGLVLDLLVRLGDVAGG